MAVLALWRSVVIKQRFQGQTGWVLAKFHDDNTQEYPTHIELLNQAKIDGKRFQDICEQIQIETIY